MAISDQQRENIVALVVATFNAAPGANFLREFANAIEAGVSFEQLADILVATPQFQQEILKGAVTNEAIAAVLLNNFGLSAGNTDPASPDAQAEEFFIARLEQGASISDIIIEAGVFLLGDTVPEEFQPTANLFQNKILVAGVYSESLSDDNVDDLQFVLEGVTADGPTTREEAEQFLEDKGLSPNAGQTFVLTSGVDSLEGTTGDDIFVAGVDNTNPTLNAGDTISGDGGIDTLRIFNENKNVSNGFKSITATSIENVEVTAGAATDTLDVSGNADVEKATLVKGVNGTITLNTAQTAGLSGTIDTAAGFATFSFTKVGGGADTAALELNATDLDSGNGVKIAGVETLNVAAAGANLLGTAAIDATALNITGDGSVSTILAASGGGASVTKTIDGSAATGDLTIDNSSAGAQDESIKTGSGDDIYTTQYANLSDVDAIDLGEGTDSLRFTDVATFNDATTGARLSKVTGVEQLGTIGALLTIDGDNVTQTSYYTEGAGGDFALTDIANNATVTFGAGAVAASQVGMKLGANTLNVKLAGDETTAVDVTTGPGLIVTGSSTINVDSSGFADVTENLLDMTAAGNQSVVITGAQDLIFVATASAPAATGFNIDASAFTGDLDVTGTAASDIIKGGSGDDIIDGGAGATVADTLTGNAGNDDFFVLAGATDATFDTITDFVSGSDAIEFGGAAGSATNYTEAAAAVADFAAALAAAEAEFDGTVVYNAQQVGSDVFVFFDAGADGDADQAVQLTGVALGGIASGDII